VLVPLKVTVAAWPEPFIRRGELFTVTVAVEAAWLIVKLPADNPVSVV